MSHVHHLTYIRKYQERSEDLQGLCEPCHEFTHGKLQRDPMLDVVPCLSGQEIHSVYLAGRFDRDKDWRSDIVPRWSLGNGYGRNNDNLIAILPDGRQIEYQGPYWVELGHGCGGYGPHACGDDYTPGDHCTLGAMEVFDPSELIEECKCNIVQADLCFCWIDSREALGTLVEAGYYHRGQGGFLAVAMPKWDRELWFVSFMADRFILANTASEAWKMLWANHASMRGEVSDPHGSLDEQDIEVPDFPDDYVWDLSNHQNP